MARASLLAIAVVAVAAAAPAAAQTAVVHDTESEFLPGAFVQTILQGSEEAPEIRLGTYAQSSWTFQDEDIAGWTYASSPAGNTAVEDPVGQIHLRASYASAEAYAYAYRTDQAVPSICVVEWRVYMDAIQPANAGGTYNQPRGGCCRLDLQRSSGGLRIDIFSDRMVSFYRNGTTGYDYPTLTSVDIATANGQWYTYRFECDFTTMRAQVYRDGAWVGEFLADARNAAGNTLRALAYSRTSVSGVADFHVDSVRLGTQVQMTYDDGTYTSPAMMVVAASFGDLSWNATPPNPYPWGPWVKSPNNPILPSPCLNENIVCDAEDPLQQPLLVDGYYWMAYATGGGSGTIRLARTADPTLMTWSDYPGNPILSPGLGPDGQEQYVYSPHVFRYGGSWYLFYDVSMAADSRQRNAFATAPALTGPWTKGQIILQVGGAGEWDELRVTEPFVWKEGDTWFLYYMGDRVCSGCNEQVGLATTTAALFPLGPEPGGLWTKHGLVLPYSSDPTAWDRGLTADPSIVKVGDLFFMRYTGSYANEHWQLGAAWAMDPYGPWQRPAAPEITLGPTGAWDDDRLVRGAIHFHDGRWYSPYTGNDGSAYRGGIASAAPVAPEDNLSFETRSSADGAEWEEWRPVTNGSAIASTPDTYFQYRASFTAATGGVSPVLRGVSFDYVQSPVGVAADRPIATLGTDGGVTLAWRYDPAAIVAFHVERSRGGGAWLRLTAEPLSDGDGRIVFHDPGDGFAAGDVLRYRFVALRGGVEIGPGLEVAVSYTPGGAPRALALRGVHPNPFNPSTTISFDLPRAGRATVAIYAVSGRLVRELLDETLPAASHAVAWDGADGAGRAAASGVYFARLEFDGQVKVRKMTLAK